MPLALQLRLRASCLTWRRVESHGLLQPHYQIFGRQVWTGKKNAKRSVKSPGPEPEPEPDPRQSMNTLEHPDEFTLLEELFPEEALRRNMPVEHDRQVPRLALDLPDTVDVSGHGAESDSRANGRFPEMPLDKAASWRRFRDTRKQYVRLQNQGEHTSVLVFRNASKNLTDEDFRRVIPQGKYIEGWNLDRGDIIKVIPGRDTATLERRNFYFLLFKSPLSAFSYQTHVTRLHKLSQIHTPTSFMSPIPPPPGYSVQGEDIAALLQSYSLLPPSQDIEIRQISPPFKPSVQQIVNYEGYPSIVERRDRYPVEVMLRLEGAQLPMSTIRDVLIKSAKDRNLPWNLRDGHNLTLWKWEVTGANVSPMSSRRLPEGAEDDGRREEVRRDSNSQDHKSGQEDHPQQKAQLPPSYIVGLHTEAEAQTFVRFWHRRPMEHPDHDFLNGDIAPVVNAEILW